jgi:uncharacterized protein YegL
MSSQLRLVSKTAASLLEGTAEPELSCLVLCDLSASMNERAPESEHPKIDQLNAGIQTLPAEILKDAQAARRVRLAAITFGRKVEIAQSFVPASAFKLPTFEAHGDTPMAEAILQGFDLLEERRVICEKRDRDIYGPWICLYTDGHSTSAARLMERVRQRIHETDSPERGPRQIAFFAVGVEGADMQQLAWLSRRAPLKLKGCDYGRMFAWLGQSLKHLSQKNPGERGRTADPRDFDMTVGG